MRTKERGERGAEGEWIGSAEGTHFQSGACCSARTARATTILRPWRSAGVYLRRAERARCTSHMGTAKMGAREEGVFKGVKGGLRGLRGC